MAAKTPALPDMTNEPEEAAAALRAAGDDIARAHWAELAERTRRPLRHQARRCACALGGSCVRCGRCVEAHCTCGARATHHGLCLESRPCNCAVADASARCAFCRGCRRVKGGGHCRCEQHERQRLRHLEDPTHEAAGNGSSETPCACFTVSANALPRAAAPSAKRTQRIRRLRQAMGVPSVENLYQTTIVSAFGRADSEDEDESGETDERAETDELCGVLHRPLAKRLFPEGSYAPPYQRLHLRDGASFLESIEPREHNERAFDAVTAEQIERGLSNMLYTKARDSAMPSDGLVDYVIHASSIKVGQASEMVGTFDDSAAVAAAIVVEEYTKQVVSDLLLSTERRPERALTKSDVQAFALHLLKGLSWPLFCELHNCGRDATKQDDALVRVIADMVALVGAPSPGDRAEVAPWIRETVTLYQDQWEAANERHKVSGLPSYCFTLETKLPGDQLVRVRANGFDTRDQAMRKVDTVKETLRSQHERLWIVAQKAYPALRQQLLSAERERSPRRKIPKLTMAELRLLAAHNPVLQAKLEHRRLQYNKGRKLETLKKKAEAQKRKAELRALTKPLPPVPRRPVGRPRKIQPVAKP